MRIIDADKLKNRIKGGIDWQDLISAILKWIDLQETVASCKTCVWRAALCASRGWLLPPL